MVIMGKKMCYSVLSVKITDIVVKKYTLRKNIEPDFLLAILYSKIS